MATPHEILVRPLVTEKNTNLMVLNKYCFEVLRDADKASVKRAVEAVFNVRVTAVHTMNVRGKLRRRGRESGYTRSWKKAVVTLAEGDRIEIFEA